MELICTILATHYGNRVWDISPTKEGKSAESYRVIGQSDKLFIKLDVDGVGLDRLSHIEVAPRLLYHGEQQGRRYIIQQYVEGTHPDRAWCRAHIGEIAQLMRRYHYNRELCDELALVRATDPASHVAEAIKDLKAGPHPYAAREIEVLENTAHSAILDELAPVNIDPNPTNFLVARRLYMIDWDNITLSDPMKDISMLLWRYVDRDVWNTFFDSYGIDFGVLQQRIRFYWWLAHGSLVVAQWFTKRGDDREARSYMRDFINATNCLCELI